MKFKMHKTLVCFVLVAYVCCQSLTSDEKNNIVEKHNIIRTGINIFPSIPLMAWDVTLEEFANRYASSCPNTTTSNLPLNPNRKLSDGTTVGQQIFSSTDNFDPVEGVDNWASSSAHYNYANNTCEQNKSCGTYTQIVWRRSTRIGCARVNCLGYFFSYNLLCNYVEVGNVIGKKPY
ncbi:pathogenesis-related protein [Acrasis kona]|uniref:Pathogenesis-related protein n=1 Tax=Acrasis kona TaxID=1008807 RepID=A0AAW2Z865_9EUKA